MEATALYRPIIKRSWQIAKKFRGLWFFGFFTALLGVGGEFEIFLRFINPRANQTILETLFTEVVGWGKVFATIPGGFWHGLWSASINDPGSLIAIILMLVLALAIAIFFVWLAIISQIGIVRNIDIIEKNKKPTVNEGIAFAIKKFWPVLAINFIFKVIVAVLFAIMGLGVWWVIAQSVLGTIIYVIVGVIFVIAILILSFIVRYCLFYFILTKRTVKESLQAAVELFKNNWLVSLEIALILFIVYIIATLAITLVVLILMTFPWVVAFYYRGALLLATLFSFVGVAITAIIAVWLTAFLTTFQWASWTVLFNKINSGDGLSKLTRVSQTISDYFDNRK